MTVYHNKQVVLEGVRTWLEVILTEASVAEDYAWFDADKVLDTPVNGPAPEGPYFTLQLLSLGRRRGSGRQRDIDGNPLDFVDDDVMIQAYGEDAVNALAYALYIWNTDDADALRGTVAAKGVQVITDDTTVSLIDAFLETDYDVRGVQTVRVACQRTVARVTPDTRLVEVSGDVDDIAVQASALLE